MRLRFFQVFKEFSHETLTRHCNLDYDREIAIVAETRENGRKIVGVSLLTTDPGRKHGEFAVVVSDQWQGIGLGSKLVDCIIEVGKDMDLETIYGYVSSNNPRMIDLCTRKGFNIQRVDAELVKATLNLSEKELRA
jgi:acetyltransferase